MAKLNVPKSVRAAARIAAKMGDPIGAGVSSPRREIVSDFTQQQKSVSWNFHVGDLVKFRDYMGKVRYGTVITAQGSTVEIISSGGTARLPCQSISLIERIEEEVK
jgi:hypothetical protein